MLFWRLLLFSSAASEFIASATRSSIFMLWESSG